MRRRLLGWALWTMGGCATSVNASGPAADAGAVADVASTDAPAPTRDAALTTPEAMVGGRWRAVRYRSVVNGQVVEIADDTPFDRDFARRVNGVLIVDESRLRMNVGLFSVTGPLLSLSGNNDVPWLPLLRATEGRWRATANGLLFEDARAPGGAPLNFSLDAEGRLWVTVTDVGIRRESFSIAFARDPNPVRRDRLELSAQLVWRAEGAIPDTFAPMLFWDVPGSERPEQRLSAGPWGGAAPRRTRTVSLDFAGPPAGMVQGRVRGIPVALAYPSAYADSDRDGRLGTGEGPPLYSPLAIVWRGEGPAEDLRGTPFEGFLPGYSLAMPNWVPVDNPGAAVGLVPFDNTLLPSFTMASDDTVSPAYRLADHLP